MDNKLHRRCDTEKLLSYAEFLEVCEEALGINKFQSWNHTEQSGGGETEVLYETQTSFIGIEYTGAGSWRFHYNGVTDKRLTVVGEGLTLEEAVSNHKERYREAYYN